MLQTYVPKLNQFLTCVGDPLAARLGSTHLTKDVCLICLAWKHMLTFTFIGNNRDSSTHNFVL